MDLMDNNLHVKARFDLCGFFFQLINLFVANKIE